MDDQQRMNQSDHDLLIRVDTRLEALTKEIIEFKNGLTSRIAVLEATKLDRDEALRMKHEGDTLHNDHETRIRRVERWGFIGIGALGIIQVVIAIAK